jgi:hypothetical protein
VITSQHRILLLGLGALSGLLGFLGLGVSLYRPWQKMLLTENAGGPIFTSFDTWYYVCRASSALFAVGIGLIVLYAVELDRNVARRIRAWKLIACAGVLLLPAPIVGLILSTHRAMNDSKVRLVLPSADQAPELPDNPEHVDPDRGDSAIHPPLAISVAGVTLGLIGAVLLVSAVLRFSSLRRSLAPSPARSDDWH